MEHSRDSSSEFAPGPKIPRRGRERIMKNQKARNTAQERGPDSRLEHISDLKRVARTDEAGGIDHLPVCGFSLKCP